MPISIPKASKKNSPQRKKRVRKMTSRLVRGMRDITPIFASEQGIILNALSKTASFYGCLPTSPAFVEEVKLYTAFDPDARKKGVMVSKSRTSPTMLRMHMVPGIARSYLEHPTMRSRNPASFWYYGDIFQLPDAVGKDHSNRTQGGVLMLAAPDPVYDAQTIAIAYKMIERLGLGPVTVRVNSSGCRTCHKSFTKKLHDKYSSISASLCTSCRAAYRQNSIIPTLCDDESCKKAKEEFPVLLDNLCASCKKHFTTTLEYLDEIGIPYMIDPFLLRHESYWSRTIFEIYHEQSQQKIVRGGRMDNLSRLLSGSAIPMVGFDFFADDLISLFSDKQKDSALPKPRVSLIFIGEQAKRRSLSLMEQFYRSSIPVRELLSRSSLNTKLEIAKARGAKVVLILGQKEVFEDTVLVRTLSTGAQDTVPIDKVIQEVKKRLRSKAR